MNFINNIFGKSKDDRIKWIPIEDVVIDPELKGIFGQNENEINSIAEDMKVHGYNPANPITLSQDNVNVDGNTRYMASQRAGLKKVAVIYRHFESREEMIAYALKQQLHRRNLSEQDLYKYYTQLRDITTSDGKKAKTDAEIAEELHVSPRQIAKMKEIEKKASPEVMEAFKKGKVSLNQAYIQMKEDKKSEEEPDAESQPEESSPKTSAVKTTARLTEKKPARPKAEKPAVERLSLRFRPSEFDLVKSAAAAAELSVSEYVMNIVMNSVQKPREAETA